MKARLTALTCVVTVLAALAVVYGVRAQSATNPAINQQLPDLDVRDVNAWGVVKGRRLVLPMAQSNTLTFLDSGAVILVDASTGPLVFDLPSTGNPWDEGMEFTFVQVGGAGGSVTINPQGSLINGQPAYTIGASGRGDGSVTVVYTTMNQWLVTGARE